MLPTTKLRTKTVTYRGQQRMLDGIEHMKHTGWRVVTTSEDRLPTPSQRFLVLAHISVLARNSAQVVNPKPQFPSHSLGRRQIDNTKAAHERPLSTLTSAHLSRLGPIPRW